MSFESVSVNAEDYELKIIWGCVAYQTSVASYRCILVSQTNGVLN